VAAAAVMGMAACASTLDTDKLNKAIQARLAEVDLSATTISCPSFPVQSGSTFECTATINAVPVTVSVRQTSSAGDVSFEIGREVVTVGDTSGSIEREIRSEGATDVAVTCPKAVVLAAASGVIECTAVVDGDGYTVAIPVTDGKPGEATIKKT
jgi:hypothetical protein